MKYDRVKKVVPFFFFILATIFGLYNIIEHKKFSKSERDILFSNHYNNGVKRIHQSAGIVYITLDNEQVVSLTPIKDNKVAVNTFLETCKVGDIFFKNVNSDTVYVYDKNDKKISFILGVID